MGVNHVRGDYQLHIHTVREYSGAPRYLVNRSTNLTSEDPTLSRPSLARTNPILSKYTIFLNLSEVWKGDEKKASFRLLV